jgi:hypothetical protein
MNSVSCQQKRRLRLFIDVFEPKCVCIYVQTVNAGFGFQSLLLSSQLGRSAGFQYVPALLASFTFPLDVTFSARLRRQGSGCFCETIPDVLFRLEFLMKITTLEEVLSDELKDMYSAENQLIKALPKMAKAAKSDDLRQAFEKHLEQTRLHAQRLEESVVI